MLQRTFQDDGNDFHVVVRMHAKTFSRRTMSSFSTRSRPKWTLAGSYQFGEAEAVMGIEPARDRHDLFRRPVKQCFSFYFSFLIFCFFTGTIQATLSYRISPKLFHEETVQRNVSILTMDVSILTMDVSILPLRLILAMDNCRDLIQAFSFSRHLFARPVGSGMDRKALVPQRNDDDGIIPFRHVKQFNGFCMIEASS
jgi:hypothetical protein